MINLSEYGKLIMKQEFTADIENNKIISILYIGHNKKFDDSIVAMDIEALKTTGYECSVTSNNKQTKFICNNISTVNRILSVADNSYDTEYNTAVKIHNYDNSKDKTDNTFNVAVNGILLELDKDKKMIIDNNYFADEVIIKNNKVTSQYEFTDYGINCYDPELKMKMYLLNGLNTSSYGADRIELSNISRNSTICKEIPNLTRIPSKMTVYNNSDILFNTDISVDEYSGLDNSYLYESYNTEEFGPEPIFISSLHPFRYDNFDTNLITTPNLYCIDQIDRSLDSGEKIIIYSREVYDIDNIDKLLADIEKVKDSKEPNIPII